MVIALTDEQLQIKKMVNDLSKEKMAPQVRGHEENGTFPAENFDLLKEQGLMGLVLPPPFGGSGADTNTFLFTVEALAKACPATAFLYTTHIASSLAILAMSNDEQKGQYLKRLASGDLLCGLALTEDGGGTNPLSIRTTATKVEAGYALNGTKVYISGAGACSLYLVLAKTSDAPGPSSLSMFIIDKETPGFTIGSMESKMGLRSLPTGELVFENCIVPESARLGQEGAGFQVFGVAAGLAALGAGSIALGLAEEATNQTKNYILERCVMGQKLAEIQAVQLKFADMLMETNSIRCLLNQAAFDRDHSPPGPIASIFQAKINATEKALKIIDLGIQLHGAYGYSKDFPLEKYYRDARALTIHFGTNDVLRQQMSKLVLNLM